jgi:hypothetical protein
MKGWHYPLSGGDIERALSIIPRPGELLLVVPVGDRRDDYAQTLHDARFRMNRKQSNRLP